MFSLLVLILELSMMFSLFVAVPALLIIRIYSAFNAELDLKKKLIAILVPFSIGYFSLITKENKYFRLYKVLLTVFLVTTLLGIMFTLYVSVI